MTDIKESLKDAYAKAQATAIHCEDVVHKAAVVCALERIESKLRMHRTENKTLDINLTDIVNMSEGVLKTVEKELLALSIPNSYYVSTTGYRNESMAYSIKINL